MQPYKQWKKDGIWTLELVRECGFQSAQKCLDNQERVYQQELDALPKLANVKVAEKQKIYLKEWIARTRESLGTLIAEGQ